MNVGELTSSIRWMDQIYGSGQADAPVISYPKMGSTDNTYTKNALGKIRWAEDYIAQYIPYSTPFPEEAGDNIGRLCALVSIYPKEGNTHTFCRPEAWKKFNLGRWPDAIMLREVYYIENPPLLKDIVTTEDYRRITSGYRGKLAPFPSYAYDSLVSLALRYESNLYRSPEALRYLEQNIDNNPTMQIVANRRTGKAGRVYALTLSHFPGLIKIGSAFDPPMRKAQLSTAIPYNFDCHASEPFEDCRSAEMAIHKELSHRRVRPDREWFEVTLDEFNAACTEIRKRYVNV